MLCSISDLDRLLFIAIPSNVLYVSALGCIGPCERHLGCEARKQQLVMQLSMFRAFRHSLLQALQLRACSVDASAVVAEVEVPGGRVPATGQLQFVGDRIAVTTPRLPCYRTIDLAGKDVADAVVPHAVDESLAVRMYSCMARLQVVDLLFYEAQRQVRAAHGKPCRWWVGSWVGRKGGCYHMTWRVNMWCSRSQGRFSFSMTSQGEEATVIGSAAALQPQDVIFAQCGFLEAAVLPP
jgi:hypothetical protein